MVMSIRPPETFLDANTNAAVDFKVYISAPNTDPKDESKRLIITDSSSGEVTSNPFLINSDGYPKNTDGNVIAPIIQEQEYAILFESIGGGQQYSESHVKGDAFGISSGGSGDFMVDATINNFPLAQATNLTGSNLIYVQSTAAGWEASALGPVDGYYAYFTGQIGVPGSGAPELFFDSAGNEWKRTSESELPFTNQANIVTETTRNDTQDGLIQDNTDAIAALPLAVITVFDPAISYLVGDRVGNAGNIFVARVIVSPGAFDPTEWIKIGITTLFENLVGVPNATVIDWSSAGNLNDFDEVMLTGDVTLGGGSFEGASGNSVPVPNAISTGEATVFSVTNPGIPGAIITCKLGSLTATGGTVAIAGITFTGVFTGVYGIRY